jgi:hypothetical protein
MAGYTRQSVADIINGLDITAPPLNAEFNQLAAAFNSITGHSHDGSTGNAPRIPLATSVSGFLPAANGGVGGRNNTASASNPTVSADNTGGYAVGSIWVNTATGRAFRCVGNATGSAVWREIVQINTNNTITPETTNTVDIGTTTLRYRDIFLSRNADVGGNLAVTGTLTASGASTLASVAATSLTVSGASTLATATINGGSINNTQIGNTTRSTGAFTTISSTAAATLASAVVSGGTIDNAVIGGTTPSVGTFTNLTATVGITGNLTGNVTGNVTGNITGAVTGNVTGNVTGDITSAGTSTFNNVTVNGTLDMNAGTAATITGLSTPSNATDAATKAYVDSEISNLIGGAGAALDTLEELADALNNDPNFAATVTAEIATKVSKAGDTMTGNLAMSGQKVTGLGTPTSGSDATTKTYVDNADALKLNLAGGTMSGDIIMAGNKVTGLATPTQAGDATSKDYIDNLFGSTQSAANSAAAAAVSESNAATSEQNAAVSEQNAAQSEQNASVSEANALTSEQNALASEQAAAQSEINAASSESTAVASAAAALVSEQNSALSESNAASSESNAAQSEANALASEQAASQSEANAAVSEQNAATSEANALVSEQNAAQSEANTLALANTFVPRTSTTGAAVVPTGTEAERDSVPLAGYFRFNSDVAKFEGYNGTAWGAVGGGATGGGSDEIFIENGQVVTSNYTIPVGRNAMTTGNITINAGVVVTVSAGSRWVVL